MNLGLMFGRIERPVSKMNHRWNSTKLDGSQQLRIKRANTTLGVAFPLLQAPETEQRQTISQVDGGPRSPFISTPLLRDGA